jgi:hypothetical protein
METMDPSDLAFAGAVAGSFAVWGAFHGCTSLVHVVKGWSTSKKRAREDDEDDEDTSSPSPSQRRKIEVCALCH